MSNEMNEIKNLIKQLQKRDKYIQSLNGQKLSIDGELERSYLHQNVYQNGKIVKTEQDSAKDERENKEVFNILLSIQNRIDSFLN